jgi:hypothetical protein
VGIMVGTTVGTMVGMGATMAGAITHTGAITHFIGELGQRGGPTQGGLMGTTPDRLTKGGPTIHRG